MYHLNRNTLFLNDCLGLKPVDRKYYVSGQDINPSTGKAYALNPNRGWVWDDEYFAQNYGGEYERRNAGRKYGESDAQAMDRRNREEAERLRAETKVKEDAFMGKLGGVPAAFEALRTKIGLPEAEQAYRAAGDTAIGASDYLKSIAPTQQTIAKRVGISAPRLQQRIGAETMKYQPQVETAASGLASAERGLSSLLGDYSQSSQNIIAPLQIESGFLGESIKNQWDVFKTQLTSATDRAIAELKERGLNDRGALDRANELAKIEATAKNPTFQDLGDRMGIYVGTQLVGTTPKGNLPGSSGGTSGGTPSRSATLRPLGAANTSTNQGPVYTPPGYFTPAK